MQPSCKTKVLAVLSALFTVLDTYDDSIYLVVSQHDNYVILRLSVYCIIFVPIFMQASLLAMTRERFRDLARMSPRIINRLLFSFIEYFGLAVFLTDSEASLERAKSKCFLHTIFKKLPMTVFKLLILFASG